MTDAGYYSQTTSADQGGTMPAQRSTDDEGRDAYVGLYPVGGGRFSWARIARRGNLPDLIVADSGDNSYASASDAREAAERENEGYEIVELDAPPALSE